MAQRLHETSVSAPIETVFDFIADVHSHHLWQSGLVRSECEEDSRVAGARGVEVRRFLGREIRFPWEITICERPFCWGFRALGGPIRPQARLELTRHGEGTHIRSTLTVAGPFGWLVIGALLRQQRRNYRALKHLLESGQRQ